MNKKFIFIVFSAICFLFSAADSFAAPDLTGTTSVEKSADTALGAKNAAFNTARRNVIADVLSRYSDVKLVSAVLENTPDADLVPLISTSSISNERASNTIYNATFTMTLDRVMVGRWMAENNIPNYMAAADSAGDRITMFFYIGGGLRQWSGLMTNLREMGLDRDIELKTMQGQNVSATIPTAEKNKYLNALRELGWRVTDTDGILRIMQ